MLLLAIEEAVVVFFVLVMADRNWRLEISLIAFIEAVVA